MCNKNILFILLIFISLSKGQIDLVDFFSNCKRNVDGFNDCIKDGINNLRPYYKTGLPDYKIAPFDPFFAEEIHQRRSTPFFTYKLVLRNVTEAGWTSSYITRLRMDSNKNQMQCTQFFPDKRLNGWYEIDGIFFGNKVQNSGSWELGLFDYLQTITITRKPIKDSNGIYIENPPINLKANILSCKRLVLHIGNLAKGRTFLETMLDRIINTAWQPGFVILAPLINDLVSTAFTKIMNDNFQNFPFDTIFQC